MLDLRRQWHIAENEVKVPLDNTADAVLRIEVVATLPAHVSVNIGIDVPIGMAEGSMSKSVIVDENAEYVVVTGSGNIAVSVVSVDYYEKEETNSVPDQVPVELGSETMEQRIMRMVNDRLAAHEDGVGHEYKSSEDDMDASDDDPEYGPGYQPKSHVVADLDDAYRKHLARSTERLAHGLQSAGDEDGNDPGGDANHDRPSAASAEPTESTERLKRHAGNGAARQQNT